MKKQFTKMMSVVLSLLMLCTALPLTGSAYTQTSGRLGQNVFWAIDNEGTLTVSGTGDMYHSSSIDLPYGIKSIVISDGVTSIGDGVFEDCEELTSVIISDTVKYIGSYAFAGCKKLESITIPNSVTSIESWAFRYCTNLVNVTIGNNVKYIGDCAFWACENIDSIIIPNSVTEIGESAFYYCKSLKSVTLSKTLISIGQWAFQNCKRLTSITIPDSVTSVGLGAFVDCNSLEEIIVSENNTNYSAEDGVLFNKDKSVLIQYPIGNERTVYAIPDGVTSIDNYAFSCCENLEKIRIPITVKTFGDMVFADCTNIPDIYFVGSQEQWNGIDFGYSNENLKENFHFNCCSVNSDFNHSYTTIVTPSTCSEQGYTTYTCACGDTYNDDYVGYDYTVHVNEDGDGLCDYCGELATDCSCNCHSTNSFIAFFWKILNFLQRLFGTNPVCSCGMAHY